MKKWAPPWGAFFPALVALSLYTAARVAEQVKAGLEALPYGQRSASRALGMTELNSYRLILLPQALRIVLPTLTSEVMGIFKNTSVALTIGLLELTAQARQINEFTFKTFQAFGAATLAYLALALCVFVLMHWIERALRVPGTEPPSRRVARHKPKQGAA
jgi:glutamate/aspartate transport system permease protein